MAKFIKLYLIKHVILEKRPLNLPYKNIKMVSEQQTIPPITKVDNDEIDLMALAFKIWKGRKVILKTIAIGLGIGILVALLSPKEYSASTTVVPQMGQTNNKLGGLSSLAAMAGFNLDMASGGDNLSPLVYPKIVNSARFQLELMNTPFTFSGVDKPVSIYEYYINIEKPSFLSLVKKYTIGLPGIIITAIKGENNNKGITEENEDPVILSEKQENIRKLTSKKIFVTPDAKNGYITVGASFSEPLLTAQVAQKTREMLQEYITKLKIEKAVARLDFVEKLYIEKKKDFEMAQNRLARHRDQNQHISTAIAKTTEERLQSEYSISQNVYNELAKQLEQAKIQVKEETPVFSVLEQVMVPMEKTKPKRSMILAVWFFLGIFCGIAIILGKDFYETISEKWNEQKESKI